MSILVVFFNRYGRLRSGWRASVFAALFFVLAVILSVIFNAALAILGAPAQTAIVRQATFVLSFSILFVAAILIGWVCARGLEGLPLKSLGWGYLHGKCWRNLIFGIFFGAVSLLLATGVAAFGGDLKFTFNQTADNSAIAKTVLLSAVIFAFGAAGEEALFRGYPVQTFVRANLAWVAILLTSVFFAFVHAQNPNVTLFGLTNTALAGVWFVVAYLKTRNLWFPFGMHWAWNWTMAAILGLPVSGITDITPDPIWRGVDAGPVWLTGGHYGLEGGAACTVALIISMIAIWRAPFLRPTADMLALTDQENPREIQNANLNLTDNIK